MTADVVNPAVAGQLSGQQITPPLRDGTETRIDSDGSGESLPTADRD